MQLFNESTLRKLEQLTLVAERVRVGVMKGNRRSRKRGTSIEFADYRNYTKGDDLRRLDWNVYARLERPFIKLLEEEEDLAVHLLIDASASMNWPDDPTNKPTNQQTNKLIYALQLAGALGHISLTSGDLLTVSLLHSGGDRHWGPHRNQQNSLRLLQFLETGAAGGVTDLNLSLRNYALYGRRPGLLFLISDLLSPNGYQDGLNALQSRGYEVGLIHLLSPDEVDPPVSGDLKLVDVETGQDAEITLDPTTLSHYRERLREWQAQIANYCANRGVHYIPVTTDLSWEQLVMQTLRVKGVVK
ncbi:MAG: DUF58 domain-containing protein [Ardenticatenaceae bacterium]|nr:DUF58 domain-containing protein [Ardenticatenaceae bacterium]MCB9444248.1 DUF58 domain-containing protein [Ardenticatenaceae bacterium]